MDFYNRCKSFLGLPSSNSTQNSNTNNGSSRTNMRDDFVREAPNEHYEDDHGRFGFNVFSNPLEMHRYFEHQMNEIMKSFGMFENYGEPFPNDHADPFFGDDPYGSNSIEAFQFPAIEEFQNPDQPTGSLREQYLKPGYEQATLHGENKTDKDVDGKFDMGDLDSVLKGRPSQVQPKSFFFGQSITSKTVRNADGTIEMHKTVKDQYGNEQVTITRKQGDKEYSVTTKTDCDGRQEVIENFVNMDEKDKDSFLGTSPSNGHLIDSGSNDKIPENWFPFDKFFK